MLFTIENIHQWEKVVETLQSVIKHPILLLKGNLGAGKTTFTQYLLKKMGSNDEVNSPTYSLVNEYHTPKGTVYHFDLYRLKNIEEAFDFGMEEYLENGHLCIIEWPEIYMSELEGLPYHSLEIINHGQHREIHFE